MQSIIDFLIELARLSYSGIQSLLLKVLYLGLIGFVLGLMIYFILLKTKFRYINKQTSLHRDVSLGFIFLWTIAGLLLIYNIYWFFVIYVNGARFFVFDDGIFWAALSPSLLVYIVIIILFYYKYRIVKSFTN